MLRLRADEINNTTEVSSGGTLLTRAAQNGRQATSTTLLKMDGVGCDVRLYTRRNDGATALLCASLQGHEAVVAVLITAGAGVDKADRADITPLIGASTDGHEAVVGDDHCGCQRRHGDQPWHHPLIIASLQGHEAVVASLITAGANVDKASRGGRTPLIRASENAIGNEGCAGERV